MKFAKVRQNKVIFIIPVKTPEMKSFTAIPDVGPTGRSPHIWGPQFNNWYHPFLASFSSRLCCSNPNLSIPSIVQFGRLRAPLCGGPRFFHKKAIDRGKLYPVLKIPHLVRSLFPWGKIRKINLNFLLLWRKPFPINGFSQNKEKLFHIPAQTCPYELPLSTVGSSAQGAGEGQPTPFPWKWGLFNDFILPGK